MKFFIICVGLFLNFINFLNGQQDFLCVRDGLFAAYNCKKYYECIYTDTSFAYKILHSCQSGLLFDNRLQSCNWAFLVKCSDKIVVNPDEVTAGYVSISPTKANTQTQVTSSSSSGEFECPQDGLYAAPMCKKYYQCVNTNTPSAFKILVACPSGLLFDNTLKICNWANLVKCDEINNNIVTSSANPKTKTLPTLSSTLPASTSTSSSSSSLINPTFDEFSKALTANGYPAPSKQQYTNFINGASTKGGIRSKRELAMFLSQIMHESGGLKYKLEIACGTGCANCPGSYNTPQDYSGKYYCGRGYIQLSWYFNYKAASLDLYGNDTLCRDPDQVATNDEIAWAVSFWYWKANVRSNKDVLNGYFGSSTKLINGALECNGANTYIAKRRFNLYVVTLKAFNINETPIETGCY